MSTENLWRGDARPIAQIDTIAIAGNATGNGWANFTINMKVIPTPIVSGMTPGNISDAIQANLFANTSTVPEVAELSYASDSAGNVTITSTAGVPFTATIANSTGIGTTFTYTNTQAADGPNWITTVTNWSLGHIPTTGEIADFSQGADALYGLGSLTWTPDAIRVRPTYTGSIGLPLFNSGGVSPYYEYRPRGIPVNGNMAVGDGDPTTGGGPGRIVANLTGDSACMTVYLTGASADGNPVVEIMGFNGANHTLPTLNVFGGSVGVGFNVLPANATITTIRQTGGTLTLRGNVSAGNFTNITLSNGTLSLVGDFGALNITGGEATLAEPCAPGTVTADGGTVFYNCNAPSANPVMIFRGGGSVNAPTLDASANTFPRSIGAGSMFIGGAILNDPENTCAFQSSTAVTMDKTSLAVSAVGHRFTIYRQ